MDRIYGFFGDYRFLSNFWITPVIHDGIRYTNAEAAFQAAKCVDPKDRAPFTVMNPRDAKRSGRRVALRPDWENVKYGVMEDIVRSKFARSPRLREKLLATNDAELVEANDWRDTCWGVDKKTGQGENRLGKILMKVREELRSANPEPVTTQNER